MYLIFSGIVAMGVQLSWKSLLQMTDEAENEVEFFHRSAAIPDAFKIDIAENQKPEFRRKETVLSITEILNGFTDIIENNANWETFAKLALKKIYLKIKERNFIIILPR